MDSNNDTTIKVLDFGARNNKFKLIIELYLAHHSVTALDKNPENKDVTFFEWKQYGKLPYDDNSFDVVTCLGTMTYIEKGIVAPLIQEFHRVLKPNGKLYIAHSWSGNPLNYDGKPLGYCNSIIDIFANCHDYYEGGHKRVMRTIIGYLSYVYWEATK